MDFHHPIMNTLWGHGGRSIIIIRRRRRTILPQPVLWFQLSWGDLIIIPLIISMLRFTLHSIHLNIPLNLFQIRTPLQSNQLTMMKCTSSWNHSTQSMMVILWMLTSRCFRLEQWWLLLQIFLHNLLCCFINMGEQMFLSKITCHTFYVCPNQGHW